MEKIIAMLTAADLNLATLVDSISSAIEDALESSSSRLVAEVMQRQHLVVVSGCNDGCVCLLFECTSPHCLSAGKLLLEFVVYISNY